MNVQNVLKSFVCFFNIDDENSRYFIAYDLMHKMHWPLMWDKGRMLCTRKLGSLANTTRRIRGSKNGVGTSI
jgi:hypothetical protein